MPTYQRQVLKNQLQGITNELAQVRPELRTNPDLKPKYNKLLKQFTTLDYILKKYPNDDSPNSGTITIPQSVIDKIKK